MVERAYEPTHATLVDRARPQSAGRAVALRLAPEDVEIAGASALSPTARLELELPGSAGDLRLSLQAAAAGEYVVSGAGEGESFVELWRSAAVPDRAGFETRSTLLERARPLTRLRIAAGGAGQGHAVAGLRIERRPFVVSRWSLIGLVWGAGLVVAAFAGLRRAAVVADPWVAALLVYSFFFEWQALGIAIVLALVAPLVVLRRASARSPVATVALTLGAIGTVGVFLPWLVGSVVASNLARQHQLTVDHRLVPDGDEVNADQIRFRGEARELRDEDFVVLFLGDSYTYGVYLDYADTFPYAFERVARSLDCKAPVRAVNAGWISASPLLGLRWLREMGEKYRPDLVLYNLDVTDFYDDLAYEQQLRWGNDLVVDPARVVAYWVKRYAPRSLGSGRLFDRLSLMLRDGNAPDDFRPELQPPRDRFFVTSQPLAQSRAHIEAGVVKNLEALSRFAREELGASMALVVYPRAYQYSLAETLRNWEAPWYEVRGPYVREPFRYFEEARGRLGYPVLDLLPVFEQAQTFPLYLEDDPHWTPAGALLAATDVASQLSAAGLIPCSGGL